jgi:hypothetical protein
MLAKLGLSAYIDKARRADTPFVGKLAERNVLENALKTALAIEENKDAHLSGAHGTSTQA